MSNGADVEPECPATNLNTLSHNALPQEVQAHIDLFISFGKDTSVDLNADLEARIDKSYACLDALLMALYEEQYIAEEFYKSIESLCP